MGRRLRLSSAAWVLWIAGGALGVACDGGACEEDVRAQVLEARASLVIGEHPIEAEVARTDVERERGWKHRRCDLEALLIVAPEEGELGIWGCGLVETVDVLWIRDDTVLALQALEPCPEPCGACPVIEPEGPVEAAIELPAGSVSVDVGASVSGIGPWLPSAP